MRVKFSKEFSKAMEKLSGKLRKAEGSAAKASEMMEDESDWSDG